MMTRFKLRARVTRFGEISPLWQKFTSRWQIFLFGKMLSILEEMCEIIGLIFIVANGQILKNNLSHLVTLLGTYEAISRIYV